MLVKEQGVNMFAIVEQDIAEKGGDGFYVVLSASTDVTITVDLVYRLFL